MPPTFCNACVEDGLDGAMCFWCQHFDVDGGGELRPPDMTISEGWCARHVHKTGEQDCCVEFHCWRADEFPAQPASS